jgi:hypothetical protein
MHTHVPSPTIAFDLLEHALAITVGVGLGPKSEHVDGVADSGCGAAPCGLW